MGKVGLDAVGACSCRACVQLRAHGAVVWAACCIAEVKQERGSRAVE